jgi:hypothetical protein
MFRSCLSLTRFYFLGGFSLSWRNAKSSSKTACFSKSTKRRTSFNERNFLFVLGVYQ